VDEEYKDRSKYAADLARMPFQGQIAAIKNRYGRDLDNYSHGESFLTLFQSRFVPDGLYLLDEPEAALSPTRQLTFIAALKQMLEENAQFIIATHSPIILAFPDATILNFKDGRMEQVQYAELEHVQLTKAFLNDPESYLRYL
jgi:predicted ATPase